MRPATRTSWSGFRFALAAFAVLLLARVGFEYWADDLQTPPLDAPIAVAAGGALDQRIRLRARDSHRMQLRFLTAGSDYDRLRALLEQPVYRDGKRVSAGLEVPVRWSLSEIGSGRVVAAGEKATEDVSGWNSDEFSRSVASFAAPPGWYRLQVRIARPVPELAGVPARVLVGLNPKASGSWQTEWAWLGRLLCLPLDPLLAIAAALLAWFGGRRWRASRRAAAATA